ncbi:ASCH domain-containing protein [Listeria kieliensis]|uniref:RNA-binding protein n=1 Tax=Listeria kieliensis TaxID=1621700 RepID=A0A3D8TRQ0_9LIST|nr:ASCH domain-containing protein [Listeria kieliensis]RDX01392.1 RNA-binding protein [Listeria kieliensis]
MNREIENYWLKYASEHNLNLQVPDYWMFGDGSKKMGDELADLVLAGKKTGTCAAKVVYDLENEVMPTVGQYDIVLNGDEFPVAIIKYTAVEEVPMNEVSEAFALSEGEGDLTYNYWYTEHEKFFTWELKQYGMTFRPDLILVCQTFEVVDANSNRL